MPTTSRDHVIPPWLIRFRLSLWTSIRQASPLALDIVAAQSIDLYRIVRWLRPAPFAGTIGRPQAPHLLRHIASRLVTAQYIGGMNVEDERFRSLWRRRGVVVRKPSHSRGRYGIWVSDGSLNVVVAFGEATLEVTGSRSTLTIAKHVPAALRAAMLGRPMEQVASHPLFAGRGYVIVRTSADDTRTTIEFETGSKAIRLPVPQPRRASESSPPSRKLRNVRRPGTHRDA